MVIRCNILLGFSVLVSKWVIRRQIGNYSCLVSGILMELEYDEFPMKLRRVQVIHFTSFEFV